jgi:hypothetical protein
MGKRLSPAETNAAPLTVTLIPPEESSPAAFPAASLSEIFTSEPFVPSTAAVPLNAATVATSVEAVVADDPPATTVTVEENSGPFTVPDASRSSKNTHL